jgi:hypothetical protein
MKKPIKLLLTLFILIAVSCSKEEITPESINEFSSDVGEIILG